MLFGENKLGASLSIPEMGRLDATLFGESQGRVLVAVSSTDSSDFLSYAESAGVQAHSLGKTSDSGMLKVNVGEHEVLSTEVDELRTIWENVIPHHMESSKS
jgi:phosphoribosylformylglycinamidine (FGAM) synthase-like enzyme